MKKRLMFLAATMLLAICTNAFAENTTAALEAYSALTGMNVTLATVARTTDEYLDKVMAGDYLKTPATQDEADQLALELSGLSAVTTKDIAVYAAAKQLPAAQVRNQYFRSLANVLRAEIMVNPASEEDYKNIQAILSLFLDESDDNLTRTSREVIRKTITSEHAKTIAHSYSLPASFVEFIVMDDDWDDDSWENDNTWQAGSDWNTDDLYADSLENYIDTDGVTGNSVDNSVDYASPASVDYSSPEYHTPDYNTPDYSSPASVDYNSPASVDYSSGGSGGSYDS